MRFVIAAATAPKVTGLVRGAADASGQPDELVLRGHGFKDGSQVLVEGVPAIARLIDDTRIGVQLDQRKHEPGKELNVVVHVPDKAEGDHASSDPITVVVPGKE